MDSVEDTDDAEVLSMEEHLESTLQSLDGYMEHLQAARWDIARRLHVIRIAEDDKTREAVDDYEARVEEGRPYEDTVAVDDLVSRARELATKG